MTHHRANPAKASSSHRSLEDVERLFRQQQPAVDGPQPARDGDGVALTGKGEELHAGGEGSGCNPKTRTGGWLGSCLFMQNTELLGYPLLRGKIHLILVYAAPLWISVLLASASTLSGYVAASVASCSALLQFSASAALHNGVWSATVIGMMAKLDYASIFVMISGSCATICTLLLPRGWATVCGLTQFGAALLGAICVLSGALVDAPRARSLIYVGVGLSNMLFMPVMLPVMTTFEVVCLVAMACLYIVGSAFYALRRPVLWPKVFGYHELFHVCCLLAAGCTFAVNRSVLLRAG